MAEYGRIEFLNENNKVIYTLWSNKSWIDLNEIRLFVNSKNAKFIHLGKLEVSFEELYQNMELLGYTKTIIESKLTHYFQNVDKYDNEFALYLKGDEIIIENLSMLNEIIKNNEISISGLPYKELNENETNLIQESIFFYHILKICDDYAPTRIRYIFENVIAYHFCNNKEIYPMLETLNSYKINLITEGNDAQYIGDYIRKHHSHLELYLEFLPRSVTAHTGGAKGIASTAKILHATKVNNKFIFLFDNDTAGKAALSSFQKYEKDSTKRQFIKCIKYTFCDEFSCFPKEHNEFSLEYYLCDSFESFIDNLTKYYKKKPQKGGKPYTMNLNLKQSIQKEFDATQINLKMEHIIQTIISEIKRINYKG